MLMEPPRTIHTKSLTVDFLCTPCSGCQMLLHASLLHYATNSMLAFLHMLTAARSCWNLCVDHPTQSCKDAAAAARHRHMTTLSPN